MDDAQREKPVKSISEWNKMVFGEKEVIENYEANKKNISSLATELVGASFKRLTNK